MALLFTVSLFLGISLQHLQLARKYFAAATTNSDDAMITTPATAATSTTTTAPATATSSTQVIYNSGVSTEESIILNLLSVENSSQGSLMRP